MSPICLAAGLWLSLLSGGEPLDCAEPERARQHIGRLRLAELEYAEDVHRETFWNALGRCGAGPAAEGCRAAERRRHDAIWRERRAGIEERYRRMLEAYDVRCRTSISRRASPGGRGRRGRGSARRRAGGTASRRRRAPAA